MKFRALVTFSTAVSALAAGYFGPRCCRTEVEAPPPIIIGDAAKFNPRLLTRVDLSKLAGKNLQDALQQLADASGLKLDAPPDRVKETYAGAPLRPWQTMTRGDERPITGDGIIGPLAGSVTTEQALDVLFCNYRRNVFTQNDIDSNRNPVPWFVRDGKIVIWPGNEPPTPANTVVRAYDVVSVNSKVGAQGDLYWNATTGARELTPVTINSWTEDAPIQNLIQEFVDPTSWDGDVCWITHAAPGTRLISQTPENHQRIELLLQLLGASR